MRRKRRDKSYLRVETRRRPAGHKGGTPMRISSLAGALAGSLLMATALTPVGAADMTHERALNVEKEPHNWLLHHGNYQGHRFARLNQITPENAKDLRLAFTVALGGLQSGGRYTHGNLEGTP